MNKLVQQIIAAGSGGIAPSILRDGNTVAWYDYKKGVTKDGSNLVARWNDQLGSGHDLLQAVGTNQPLFTSDGIVFDGIDNFMKTAPFTLNQPYCVYLVLKQITGTINERIIDGNNTDSGVIQQALTGATGIALYGGAQLSYTYNEIGSYQIIRATFNGVNSKIQLDNNFIAKGSAGTNNPGGITLGKAGNLSSLYSNISVKELIFRNIVDSQQNEDNIFNYLATKYRTNKVDFGGKICFTFDDGHESIYSKALPIFNARGVKATCFVPASLIGTTAYYATWDNLREIHASGHEVASHSASHAVLNTMTEAQIRQQFNTVNTLFASNNIPTPTTIAYPGGQYNDLVKSIASEYYVLGRQVLASYLQYRNHDKYIMPGWDMSQHVSHTLQSVKDKIDVANSLNYTFIIMLHEIVSGTPNPAGYEINETELSDIIDYAIASGSKIVTFKELRQQML